MLFEDKFLADLWPKMQKKQKILWFMRMGIFQGHKNA
jgi:hypothetical protein